MREGDERLRMCVFTFRSLLFLEPARQLDVESLSSTKVYTELFPVGQKLRKNSTNMRVAPLYILYEKV